MNLKKKILTIFFCSSALFVTSPFAGEINGDYRGENNITLRVISLDATNAAAQVIVDGHCSGDVAGIGKVSGNTLKFNSYTTATAKCTITVNFKDDGSSGYITEKGCQDWHGVQCSFEGYIRK